MYRINPLKRNVLITLDEVIFHAPTKHQLDPRMIEHSIIVAEERFIRPTLGYDFYYALINSKNLVITDANKVDTQTAINNSLPEGAQEVILEVGDIVNAYEYLSAEDKTLWTQHLWKLVAESVLLCAYPEGFVQFGSAGVHHEQATASPMGGGGIVTPDLRTVKWSLDKKLMDRIDPLRESMHQWLCKQQKAAPGSYENYKNTCDCNVDGVAYKRKTDVILDLYDDESEGGCCE